MNFRIKDDLRIIRSFFEISQDELATALRVEKLRIARTESGETYPREDFLDLIYSYAFNNNLRLNLQKEMFYKDDLEENHILLTHASKNELIGRIDVNSGKANNDFGSGFYCGDAYDKSASFVSRSLSSCIYFLDFNPDGLNKVVFSVNQDWMLAIAYFRGKLNNYKEHKHIKRIIDKVKNADYVIAPIADNRMFEIIDQFIDGLITDEQCKHCLAATNLGLQYVFLSDKSIDNIKILEKCFISSSEKAYYVDKQLEFQKQGYDKTKIARIEYKGKGKYIEELLK